MIKLSNEDIAQIALGLKRRCGECRGVAIYRSYTGKFNHYNGVLGGDGVRRCLECHLSYVERL